VVFGVAQPRPKIFILDGGLPEGRLEAGEQLRRDALGPQQRLFQEPAAEKHHDVLAVHPELLQVLHRRLRQRRRLLRGLLAEQLVDL